MELYNNKDKQILCPKCSKYLFTADAKDIRVREVACHSCRKLIYIIPETMEYKLVDIPKRNCSSGKRCY